MPKTAYALLFLGSVALNVILLIQAGLVSETVGGLIFSVAFAGIAAVESINQNVDRR